MDWIGLDISLLHHIKSDVTVLETTKIMFGVSTLQKGDASTENTTFSGLKMCHMFAGRLAVNILCERQKLVGSL